MITQEDTVFVSGMSPAMTEDDIQQHFGAIGVIKVSTPIILTSGIILCTSPNGRRYDFACCKAKYCLCNICYN
jgi:RNA recognition motif-containing protein